MEQSKPLKEGFLQKSHPKESLFSVTIWQKRYFVLWPTGTMEYYSGYSKRADEYCGTINLENCEDMIAPTSIGKRHNIIRLTIKMRDGKLKDFCLDCECPPVLNEWVSCLAVASGLVADELNTPESSSQQVPKSPAAGELPINRRPLPQPPAQAKFEYEIPQTHTRGDGRPLSTGDVDTYEEVESLSPTLPSSPPINHNKGKLEDSLGPTTRRYSRSASLLRQMEANQNLLKRDALPNYLNSQAFTSPAHVPPSSKPALPSSNKPAPPSSNKPSLPPVPAKPKPPHLPPKPQTQTSAPDPFLLQGNSELHQRVSQRRQEMYDQVEYPQQPSIEDSLEEYEEVQFSPEKVPIIAHRQDTIENQEGYVDVEKPDSDEDDDIPSYLPVEPSNASTSPGIPLFLPQNNSFSPPPPLPSREASSPPPPLPSHSPNMKRRSPMPPPEPQRLPRSRESSPTHFLPPTSLPEVSRQSQSPPPLPPPRNEASSLHTGIQELPPPMAPKRTSSEKYNKSPQNAKPPRRIQPYRTTEIKHSPSSVSQHSFSASSLHGDRQPMALPPSENKAQSYPLPPPPHSSIAAGKPPPPMKPKPKPSKSASTIKDLNVESSTRHPWTKSSSVLGRHANGHAQHTLVEPCPQQTNAPHTPSTRPPAVVPKPKLKPPTPSKPTINQLAAGGDVMTQSLPSPYRPDDQPPPVPPPNRLSNGEPHRKKQTQKRPPMPPPKPPKIS